MTQLQRAAARVRELEAVLRAVLGAAELTEETVFDADDSEPVYEDGSGLTVGTVRRIQAALRGPP